MFLGENTVNVATVGDILPAQDLVNYELSDGEDEFYQAIPAQDGNGNDDQGKMIYFLFASNNAQVYVTPTFARGS